MALLTDIISIRRSKRFLAALSFPVFVYLVFFQNMPTVQVMTQNNEIEVVYRDGKLVSNLLHSDIIQIFIDETHGQNLTVFLMEPRILKLLDYFTSDVIIQIKNVPIYIERNETRLVSFGMIADTVQDLQSIEFVEMENKGFEILKVKGVTSRAELDQNKLSHIFLYHQPRRLVLHLVVFYNRRDNFIWNDRIDVSDLPDWLKTSRLIFGLNATGFNGLELTETRMGDLNLLTPSNISRFLNQDFPESTFIDCNMTRVRQFYTVNPKLVVNQAGRNLELRVSKLLKSLKHVMDEVGVKYWLSSGTLLGWYRQCGVISYTSDLDFEVYITDYISDLPTSLKSHGFRQTRQLGRLNDSFEMTFHKEGLTMDIFCVYEETDHIWVGGVGSFGQKYRFIFPKISLCWGELLGVTVRVPCDTPTYLRAFYGDNWARPVRRWHWIKSPKNIKSVGQWTKKEKKETMKYIWDK